jgi:hypothetical protein
MVDTHATARPNRVTSATRRRDDNVRKLIGALRAGPLLRDDLRALLGYSLSGINKYLRLLRGTGVLEIERYIDQTRTSLGHPVYRLNRAPGIVDAYLEALDANAARLSQARPPAMPKSSHLYQSPDDVEHHVKRAPMGIPAHTALMVAFYGMDQRPGV